MFLLVYLTVGGPTPRNNWRRRGPQIDAANLGGEQSPGG
jgi:hypothetical protein